MSTVKVFLGVSSLLTIVAMLVGPVLVSAADTVDQTNDNTGNNSNNRNRTRINRRLRDDRTTSATVGNAITADITTGKNKQKDNTTGGSLTSGAIGVTGNVTNDVNQLPIVVSPLPPSDLTATHTNSNTGNNSDNINSLRLRERTNINVNTSAVVGNSVGITGNTGQNEQTGNTNAGDVLSGDATVNLNFTNTVN